MQKELIDEIESILKKMEGLSLEDMTTVVIYFLANLPLSKVETMGIIEVAKNFILNNNASEKNIEYIH